MLEDRDKRVLPAVLDSLIRLKAPDAATLLLAQLKEPDFGGQSAAARR